MARGATNQANNTYREATNTFNKDTSNANNLYADLFPMLQGEAVNPQGYGQGDLAAMNTASRQSVGGSTAGAVGEGNLAAARTRNAGAFAPAMDEAARQGTRQLSTNALNTQTANANLKQQQKSQGLAGLAGLYSQNAGNLLSALGLGNSATNAATQSGQSGWFQNLMNGVRAFSGH